MSFAGRGRGLCCILSGKCFAYLLMLTLGFYPVNQATTARRTSAAYPTCLVWHVVTIIDTNTCLPLNMAYRFKFNQKHISQPVSSIQPFTNDGQVLVYCKSPFVVKTAHAMWFLSHGISMKSHDITIPSP